MMHIRPIMNRIKDIIIPSERNEMVPYALQETGFALSVIFALLLILSPSYFSISQLASLAEPFTFSARNVIELVNASRRASGLPALVENVTLDVAATKKVDNMFEVQYFAHISPQGKTPWDFFKQSGYAYRAAGENLASDFLTAEDAQTAFMQSPTHRANILNSLYTEVGASVKQGTLHGQPTILIAQYFGKPKTTTVTVTPKPKPVAPRGIAATPAPKPVPVATAPTPAPQGTVSGEVLGTETTMSKTPPAFATESGFIAQAKNIIVFVKSHIPASVGLQLVAFAVIFGLLIALAFLVTRTGTVPMDIGLRTLVVLLFLGYAVSAGIHPWSYAEITPSAISEFLTS